MIVDALPQLYNFGSYLSPRNLQVNYLVEHTDRRKLSIQLAVVPTCRHELYVNFLSQEFGDAIRLDADG